MKKRSLIRPNIEALAAYQPGEQPTDPAILKLNTNENAFPPPDSVIQALRSLNPESLRLYPDPLSRDLRQAIADLHGCPIENVFAANGSDEILALAIRAFVVEGGTVASFDPSYSLYPVLTAIENRAFAPVELPSDFLWAMPDDFQSDLFFLANPNAPTGVLYPKPAVRAFCKRFRGVVLLDEAYVDFADENGVDLALDLANVVVARTLSKAYSLAGLRVGYAIGPAPLIEALFKVKDSYNLDRIAQLAAAAAIRDSATMRRRADAIRATRDHTLAVLRRRGFVCTDSQTNFIWARPPEGFPAAAVFAGLRARKVLVRYFPGPLTGAHLRISVGRDDQMQQFIEAVDGILSDMSDASD